MRILIVGAGALGGVIAARLVAAGAGVWLAVRTPEAAARLRASGLRVRGAGGPCRVAAPPVGTIEELADHRFDLVVVATKAADALAVAPRLVPLLADGGVLLPIQNGGVSLLLAAALGDARVLGGLSNLGATMHSPGDYEQRNGGALLVGERAGGASARAARVQAALGVAVEVRVTENLVGAIWSKLLVNCAVTTLAAVAGATFREVVATAAGRALSDRLWDEALAVALAGGARPERLAVDPIPPGWAWRSAPGAAHEAWRAGLVAFYGDLKPSMLQDFERGRATEIDLLNGYVADLGRERAVPTPANDAVVRVVHAITRRQLAPGPALLDRLVASA